MKTILITGATGFLGSHIVEELTSQNYSVVALKRSTSNLSHCSSFKDNIHWINCDSIVDAEKDIIECKPDILIHAAWSGVKASDRNNWSEQEKNLSYLVSLLEIVKKTNISKIIALGSQAEYGSFEGSVDENLTSNPTNAYGTFKVCASILIKSFAELNNINWYWIRLFSIFGPREDENWLIPAVINHLLEKSEMNLTPCEQKYDYLFAKDFANGILNVIKSDSNFSGVYNMSSGQSIKLKDILSFIENKLSPNRKLLKMGAIPYRPYQVMHMEGNSKKFFQLFNFQPAHSIFEALEETINYYIMKRDND
jgi:nucleoside-diphosphate-sugar epimerase